MNEHEIKIALIFFVVYIILKNLGWLPRIRFYWILLYSIQMKIQIKPSKSFEQKNKINAV